MVLSRKGLLTVDELRRSVEGLPAAAYRTLPYYTKWARALTSLMLERGVLLRADVDAALGPVEMEDPPVLCATALQRSALAVLGGTPQYNHGWTLAYSTEACPPPRPAAPPGPGVAPCVGRLGV